MTYAVKIGTTEAVWIDNGALPAGTVAYDGELTPDLVWGDDVQTLRQPNSAELLVISKMARIDAINAECRARLIARYGPPEKQVSIGIGVYGEQKMTQMKLGIEDMVDASNTASNAIIAATTLAEVEAVTVTWPTI